MKKKIKKMFRKFVSGCKKAFRKVIDFVTRKKKPKTLENVYEDPIYLLFPDTYTPDESRKDKDKHK